MDTHPVADFDVDHLGAGPLDDAGHLVAQRQR
jgi:hypothetical protein